MSLSTFTRSYGRCFFLSNAIHLQVRPVQASVPFRNVFTPLLAKLNPVPSTALARAVRNFSSTTSKSNLGGYFGGPQSKYTRLNRFQQYSPGHPNNQLLRITGWGLLFMTGTFFGTPFLFDLPPFSYFKAHPAHLTYAIIGLNCVVFGLWQRPRFWLPLQRYALLQKDHIYSKWSLIGSAFSHQEFWHFGMNMICLWSFGTSLAMSLGPANFASLYMNSALGASLFSLWYPRIARIALMGPSLGASGALFGMFAMFSYLAPNSKIMLFFLPIPIDAWVGFLGMTTWNLAGCVFRWGTFDYAAHVGGTAMGLLYGWWMSRKIQQQRRARRLISFPRF
ncbi:AAR092Wp [Eremothecium gossypii ATCC 10895]|uniref:AAR092Wp n=1 Tax=Eremothecium gossypii (strain ATCC 10895 / CBS 109.51 / FGSC 9923 / NRRL Y-1056) TaxID=284811 RepID=Q75EI7_EREGS|nr:AAR092Wp [Eremothecium gossypii ATCC 10895]AAS50457.2 AAR092Wp [Eremothecium gossypii ATCC 10895]AEY94743.1 FAAR092Wp [Eremothecium gossypii FDAG1]